MAGAIQADRKSVVTQINHFYNPGEQKSILDAQHVVQLRTRTGSTPVSQKEISEATVDSDSLKLDSWKT